MNERIYLDHAASTPLDSDVLSVMMPYLTTSWHNPSAQYHAARQVKHAVNDARATIALALGCRPIEVVFTAGGTEANNLAVHGIMRSYPGANIVVSTIEHDSVLAPADGYDVRHVSVSENGMVAVPDVLRQIDDQTVLVSLQYANNEVGTVQPIRDVAKEIANIRRDRKLRNVPLPLYLHTDACQAPLYLDVHVSRLGVDMMTINASKLYGPKQVGCLYIKNGVMIRPIVQGGGQERSLRSGTENVAGVIGFAAALQRAQIDRLSETARLMKIQHEVFARLISFEGVTVNGSRKHRLANNIHITVHGHDNETLMMQFDEHGIDCAVGSACSASSEDPSHVLMAMGISEDDARSSLRFTMGRSTTSADMQRVCDLLQQFVS